MAQQLVFDTWDVFTDLRFGGNSLAVVRGADELPAEILQAIAREFNLPETIFVFVPDDPANDRKVRIFTPATELPFAGHPTIGVTYSLIWSGDVVPTDGIVRLEEGVGVVEVSITAEQGVMQRATLTAAQAPEIGPAPSRVEVAAAVGVDADALIGEPVVASCGVPFVVAQMADVDALGAASVQLSAWAPIADAASGLYLWADGAPLRARMFAPEMGITEDPATGSAAVAFAGVLGAGRPDGTHEWVVHQGVEMGRPSTLHIAADVVGGNATETRVGGSAVPVMQGVLNV